MKSFDEKFRFWLPVVFITGFACVLVCRLVMLHFGMQTVKQPVYVKKKSVEALRGGIYAAQGKDAPLAQSMQVWKYSVDPGGVVLKRGKRGRTRMQLADAVAEALGQPCEKMREIYRRTSSRYNHVLTSYDSTMHDKMVFVPAHTNRMSLAREAGVRIEEQQVRLYPQGRRFSHVIGFVSRDPTNRVGAAGLELKYERYLRSIPGLVAQFEDATGKVLDDRPPEFLSPSQNGCDIYLTLDINVQYEVESALTRGIAEHHATAGWAVVMNAKTGAVLAMASVPDYEPADFVHSTTNDRINRVISESYEPGSVMKTITACAVINERLVTPDTMINTALDEPGYYRLPTDYGHHWAPYISVREALVHSSNIVYGKLGVRLGNKRLWSYMHAFGLGVKTELGLPGEEWGILPNYKKWDKVKWSRAPIGQGVAITAIQLASAYATVANDGRRMRPYLVDRIVSATGETVYKHDPELMATPIRPETARQVREMMTGVAKKGGTARRAAVRGYSVAGKTGTAQMKEGKTYSTVNFNASFVGIVPAYKPEIVILVTLQQPEFCRSQTKAQEMGIPLYNHQGGVCAAPVFRQIAEKVVRYLGIQPDQPDEVPDDDLEMTKPEGL